MTVLKRNRSNGGEIETLDLASCLMLLSRVGDSTGPAGGRLFTCKTCDRKFPSFQALGGHRASHKKPRLVTGDLNNRSSMTKQSKSHECSICGQEFAIGQALGGHMRRHRVTEKSEGAEKSGTSELTEVVTLTPVLKKSSSGSKRVLSLDLNLTPFENRVKSGNTTHHVQSWLSLGLVN